jgi:hypothetical protein
VAEDTPSSLKDLRDSVYTIMRDVYKVPFQSPPRPKRLTSTFEALCGRCEITEELDLLALFSNTDMRVENEAKSDEID